MNWRYGCWLVNCIGSMLGCIPFDVPVVYVLSFPLELTFYEILLGSIFHFDDHGYVVHSYCFFWIYFWNFLRFHCYVDFDIGTKSSPEWIFLVLFLAMLGITIVLTNLATKIAFPSLLLFCSRNPGFHSCDVDDRSKTIIHLCQFCSDYMVGLSLDGTINLQAKETNF